MSEKQSSVQKETIYCNGSVVNNTYNVTLKTVLKQNHNIIVLKNWSTGNNKVCGAMERMLNPPPSLIR